MLNPDYEQAYISSFTKIFTVLNEDYEIHVNLGKEENYEMEITKVNDKQIKDYLRICFQKQNGSLTVIASNSLDEKITKKIVKDVSLALNTNPLASYKFKDFDNYIVYHFVYVKKNVVIDNKAILENLKNSDEIENLDYNIIVNSY